MLLNKSLSREYLFTGKISRKQKENNYERKLDYNKLSNMTRKKLQKHYPSVSGEEIPKMVGSLRKISIYPKNTKQFLFTFYNCREKMYENITIQKMKSKVFQIPRLVFVLKNPKKKQSNICLRNLIAVEYFCLYLCFYETFFDVIIWNIRILPVHTRLQAWLLKISILDFCQISISR